MVISWYNNLLIILVVIFIMTVAGLSPNAHGQRNCLAELSAVHREISKTPLTASREGQLAKTLVDCMITPPPTQVQDFKKLLNDLESDRKKIDSPRIKLLISLLSRTQLDMDLESIPDLGLHPEILKKRISSIMESQVALTADLAAYEKEDKKNLPPHLYNAAFDFAKESKKRLDQVILAQFEIDRKKYTNPYTFIGQAKKNGGLQAALPYLEKLREEINQNGYRPSKVSAIQGDLKRAGLLDTGKVSSYIEQLKYFYEMDQKIQKKGPLTQIFEDYRFMEGSPLLKTVHEIGKRTDQVMQARADYANNQKIPLEGLGLDDILKKMATKDEGPALLKDPKAMALINQKLKEGIVQQREKAGGSDRDFPLEKFCQDKSREAANDGSARKRVEDFCFSARISEYLLKTHATADQLDYGYRAVVKGDDVDLKPGSGKSYFIKPLLGVHSLIFDSKSFIHQYPEAISPEADNLQLISRALGANFVDLTGKSEGELLEKIEKIDKEVKTGNFHFVVNTHHKNLGLVQDKLQDKMSAFKMVTDEPQVIRQIKGVSLPVEEKGKKDVKTQSMLENFYNRYLKAPEKGPLKPMPGTETVTLNGKPQYRLTNLKEFCRNGVGEFVDGFLDKIINENPGLFSEYPKDVGNNELILRQANPFFYKTGTGGREILKDYILGKSDKFAQDFEKRAGNTRYLPERGSAAYKTIDSYNKRNQILKKKIEDFKNLLSVLPLYFHYIPQTDYVVTPDGKVADSLDGLDFDNPVLSYFLNKKFRDAHPGKKLGDIDVQRLGEAVPSPNQCQEKDREEGSHIPGYKLGAKLKKENFEMVHNIIDGIQGNNFQVIPFNGLEDFKSKGIIPHGKASFVVDAGNILSTQGPFESFLNKSCGGKGVAFYDKDEQGNLVQMVSKGGKVEKREERENFDQCFFLGNKLKVGASFGVMKGPDFPKEVIMTLSPNTTYEEFAQIAGRYFNRLDYKDDPNVLKGLLKDIKFKLVINGAPDFLKETVTPDKLKEWFKNFLQQNENLTGRSQYLEKDALQLRPPALALPLEGKFQKMSPENFMKGLKNILGDLRPLMTKEETAGSSASPEPPTPFPAPSPPAEHFDLVVAPRQKNMDLIHDMVGKGGQIIPKNKGRLIPVENKGKQNTPTQTMLENFYHQFLKVPDKGLLKPLSGLEIITINGKPQYRLTNLKDFCQKGISEFVDGFLDTMLTANPGMFKVNPSLEGNKNFDLKNYLKDNILGKSDEIARNKGNEILKRGIEDFQALLSVLPFYFHYIPQSDYMITQSGEVADSQQGLDYENPILSYLLNKKFRDAYPDLRLGKIEAQRLEEVASSPNQCQPPTEQPNSNFPKNMEMVKYHKKNLEISNGFIDGLKNQNFQIVPFKNLKDFKSKALIPFKSTSFVVDAGNVLTSQGPFEKFLDKSCGGKGVVLFDKNNQGKEMQLLYKGGDAQEVADLNNFDHCFFISNKFKMGLNFGDFQGTNLPKELVMTVSPNIAQEEFARIAGHYLNRLDYKNDPKVLRRLIEDTKFKLVIQGAPENLDNNLSPEKLKEWLKKFLQQNENLIGSGPNSEKGTWQLDPPALVGASTTPPISSAEPPSTTGQIDGPKAPPIPEQVPNLTEIPSRPPAYFGIPIKFHPTLGKNIPFYGKDNQQNPVVIKSANNFQDPKFYLDTQSLLEKMKKIVQDIGQMKKKGTTLSPEQAAAELAILEENHMDDPEQILAMYKKLVKEQGIGTATLFPIRIMEDGLDKGTHWVDEATINQSDLDLGTTPSAKGALVKDMTLKLLTIKESSSPIGELANKLAQCSQCVLKGDDVKIGGLYYQMLKIKDSIGDTPPEAQLEELKGLCLLEKYFEACDDQGEGKQLYTDIKTWREEQGVGGCNPEISVEIKREKMEITRNQGRRERAEKIARLAGGDLSGLEKALKLLAEERNLEEKELEEDKLLRTEEKLIILKEIIKDPDFIKADPEVVTKDPEALFKLNKYNQAIAKYQENTDLAGGVETKKREREMEQRSKARQERWENILTQEDEIIGKIKDLNPELHQKYMRQYQEERVEREKFLLERQEQRKAKEESFKDETEREKIREKVKNQYLKQGTKNP